MGTWKEKMAITVAPNNASMLCACFLRKRRKLEKKNVHWERLNGNEMMTTATNEIPKGRRWAGHAFNHPECCGSPMDRPKCTSSAQRSPKNRYQKIAS